MDGLRVDVVLLEVANNLLHILGDPVEIAQDLLLLAACFGFLGELLQRFPYGFLTDRNPRRLGRLLHLERLHVDRFLLAGQHLKLLQQPAHTGPAPLHHRFHGLLNLHRCLVERSHGKPLLLRSAESVPDLQGVHRGPHVHHRITDRTSHLRRHRKRAFRELHQAVDHVAHVANDLHLPLRVLAELGGVRRSVL